MSFSTPKRTSRPFKHEFSLFFLFWGTTLACLDPDLLTQLNLIQSGFETLPICTVDFIFVLLCRGNDGYVLMAQKDNNCGVATSPTYAVPDMPWL